MLDLPSLVKKKKILTLIRLMAYQNMGKNVKRFLEKKLLIRILHIFEDK